MKELLRKIEYWLWPCNHETAYKVLHLVLDNGGSGVQCGCGKFITY